MIVQVKAFLERLLFSKLLSIVCLVCLFTPRVVVKKMLFIEWFERRCISSLSSVIGWIVNFQEDTSLDINSNQ